jgi:hypothetical protein
MIPSISYKTLIKDNLIIIGIVLLSWIIVYSNYSSVITYFYILLLGYQLLSFQKAVNIFLFSIMFLYLPNFFGGEILPFSRFTLIPLILLANKRKRIRPFNINRSSYFTLLFVAVYVVKIFADIEHLLDENEQFSLLTMIDSNVAALSIYYFLYIVFTRYTINELNDLLTIVILFVFLQASMSISLMLSSPEVFINSSSLSTFHISNEKYLSNRNEWAPFFAITSIILLIFASSKKNRNLFMYAMIGILITNVLFGLSRRGYMLFLVGYIFYLIFSRKLYASIVFIVLGLAFILFQPKVVSQRLDSVYTAQSVDDLRQASSGQFHIEAVDQSKSNITIIPNSFTNDYESYNLSESFWSGLLYRQGILGFLFQLVMLFLLLRRYLSYYKRDTSGVDLHITINLTIIITFFVMSFFSTTCYFINYVGNIRPIGLLAFILFLYTELVIHENIKRLVSENDQKI